MMQDDKEKPDPPPEEFQNFEELTRELLQVPKSVLDKEREDHRKPSGPRAV